jgi:hypothetical protein
MALIGARAKRSRLVLTRKTSISVRFIKGSITVAMVLGNSTTNRVDLRLDAGSTIVAVGISTFFSLIGMLIVLDDDVAHVASPSRRTVAAFEGTALAGSPIDTKASSRILLRTNIVALVLALRSGKEIGPIGCFRTVAFVHGSSLSRDGIGGLNGFARAIVVASQIAANFLGGVFCVINEILDFLGIFASESIPARGTSATLTNIIGVAFTIVDTKVGTLQTKAFQWLGAKLGSFIFAHLSRQAVVSVPAVLQSQCLDSVEEPSSA